MAPLPDVAQEPSLILQTTHRESFKGFSEPADLKSKTPVREQYGVSWRHPCLYREFWLRTRYGCFLGDPGSSLLHVDITEFVKDSARGCFSLTTNND